MATKENGVKTRIKKELDKAGVWYFMPAANGYGRAGIPDFICCVNGFFLSIEAKANHGTLTLLQQREMDRIQDKGGMALVVWNSDEYFNHLRAVLQALQLRERK